MDKIIEIAFTVAEDASSAVEDEQTGIDAEREVETGTRVQEHTSRNVLNGIRNSIVTKLSCDYAPLVKKSRALFWSADKSLRAAITISKQYSPGNDFWYAYHDSWDKFLSEATTGIYVLGCVGREEAFVIPYKWIHERLGSLNITQREDGCHYHVALYPESAGELVLYMKNGTKESLEQFRIKLA